MTESHPLRRHLEHNSASLVFALFKLKFRHQPAKGPPWKKCGASGRHPTSLALWNELGTWSPKQAAVSPPIAGACRQVSTLEKTEGLSYFQRIVQSTSWPRACSQPAKGMDSVSSPEVSTMFAWLGSHLPPKDRSWGVHPPCCLPTSLLFWERATALPWRVRVLWSSSPDRPLTLGSQYDKGGLSPRLSFWSSVGNTLSCRFPRKRIQLV